LVEQIDRRAFPGFEQAWDCAWPFRTVRSAERIKSLFETRSATLIESDPPDRRTSGTCEVEDLALRRETLRLANALFPTGEGRAKSRLFRALSGLPDSVAAAAS
jgi:hypothetical protein